MIHFEASGITCSLWLPVLVGLTTGVVASVLGVGGGFIRMPALIYLVGCPTLVAVGTDLFEVMITGAYGAFTYGVKGRVDLIAAMWMLLGAASARSSAPSPSSTCAATRSACCSP